MKGQTFPAAREHKMLRISLRSQLQVELSIEKFEWSMSHQVLYTKVTALVMKECNPVITDGDIWVGALKNLEIPDAPGCLAYEK